MIAFAWPWTSSPNLADGRDARQLATALCEGIGGSAAHHDATPLRFAWRPLRQDPATIAAWSPIRLADGRLAVFHGYIDNAETLAGELGVAADDAQTLYARAIEAWGDEADSRIVGEYCALVANPDSRNLRLSRSPLRAPPLIYFHNEHLVAAASVPRAIFAAGVEQHFDEQRAADSAMINFTDLESSWFEGLRRVPLGSVVELQPGEPRQLRCYYDLALVPQQRLSSAQAYVARTRELLDEAVKATMAGFARPGATLSGGLDSPQVAVRAAALVPEGRKLPTFTFHPEAGWDGITEPGMVGNERAAVEAFAALHPRIEPHFTDNRGYGHDHRWNDMFRLMGGAPSGLCNMYVCHGLFDLAREQRCDLLLLAEWGNYTFSDKGDWAFVEYLVTGRWRQLWLALKHHPHDPRSLLRRFIAMSLVPLLPDSWWRRLMRLWHPREQLKHEAMVPLSSGYRERSGANRRWAAAGFQFGRYQPRSRAHARELLFANLDGDSAEIYQAFEQLYGVPCRDPLAYRPFVEFCFGLPTEVFVRDGEMRWLAKQLARTIMPEEQSRNRLNGRWDADWLVRLRRRRDDLEEELDRIESDDELAAMLDVPRMRAALRALPDKTPTDPQIVLPIEMMLMRGLLTGRFVNYVKGRN